MWHQMLPFPCGVIVNFRSVFFCVGEGLHLIRSLAKSVELVMFAGDALIEKVRSIRSPERDIFLFKQEDGPPLNPQFSRRSPQMTK